VDVVAALFVRDVVVVVDDDDVPFLLYEDAAVVGDCLEEFRAGGGCWCVMYKLLYEFGVLRCDG
jgi:hypothetical protein